METHGNSEGSSDQMDTDADTSVERNTAKSSSVIGTDVKVQEDKSKIRKEASNDDKDQESESERQQEDKKTTTRVGEVVKNDWKVEDSKSKDIKDSVMKGRHSPNTGSSPLSASKETSDFPKGNGAENHVRLKEGAKRKRRNPSGSSRDTSGEIEDKDEDGDASESKRKKSGSGSDEFCWRCHKETVDARCSACPRSWHRRCMGGGTQSSPRNWICGECATILKAENAETRSPAMAQLSVEQLCTLLKYVVDTMRDHPGSEPFLKAVDLAEVPNYMDYIVKPMDLNLLECNVRSKLYGSTEAFMSDAIWIQHNCIVFNTCGGVYTDTSKLTNAARQVIKAARREVAEIEACPDCYARARGLPRYQPYWFIEACRKPHPLVWAKLKGFPFWPAKAMPRINGQGHVDVRFFGAHDRAWVPPRDLYLYSQEPPVAPPRKRKLDMEDCVKEITRHCRKLELAFGKFQLAPPKIQYNPRDPMQIKLMLPNYDPLSSETNARPSYSRSASPSPRRKTPFRKGRGGPPLRKDSDSANDSTTTPTTPRPDSAGSDCEKYIEATRIPKGASSPLSKIDRSDSPPSKSNSSPRAQVFPTPKKEEENKARDTSPNFDQDGKYSLISTPNTLMKRNKIRRFKGNNVVRPEDESEKKLVDRPAVKTIGVRQKQKPRQSDSDKNNHLDTSPSKHTLFDHSPTRRKERVEEKESEDISAVSTSNSNSTQNSLSGIKTSPRASKSQIRVYKPKTRMVNQVNAERAKESTINQQGADMNNTNLKPTENNIIPAVTTAKSTSTTTTITTNSETPSSKTISSYAATINSVASATVTPPNHCAPTTVEQPMAFFLLVNNGLTDASKRHPPVEDNRTSSNDSSVIVKQEPKEQQFNHQQRKESKARKSFPNKPPLYPQMANPSPPKAPATPPDAMVYIPAQRTENSTYQLPPPEAGPLTAQLHRGGQELAKRMAQLMEEAYRDASQIQSQTQAEINSSSDRENNPQATIHFLQLQMERMRWQHQQQLAELKHNTDLTLREMRASLDAERQRCVEEARREAEEERLRCVEETKRKQWCALCGNEALFYCCWNTAYCDYPCQQAHWPTHMRTCAQNPPNPNPNPNFCLGTNPSQQQQQQVMMPRLVITTQHTASNVWGA